MPTHTLILKNAIEKPKKGLFYFIKNGSIYATPCVWAKNKKKTKKVLKRTVKK